MTRRRAVAIFAAGMLTVGLAGPALADDESEVPDGPELEAVEEVEELDEAELDAEPGAEDPLAGILAQVAELADAEGLDPQDVLDGIVSTVLPDGDGGTEDVTAPLGDILAQLAALVGPMAPGDGDGEGDGEGTGGFAGLPRAAVGNLLHIAGSLEIANVPCTGGTELCFTSSLTGATFWRASAPRETTRQMALPYDVVTSEWTPSTPIVPGINPFLLAPAEVAALDPGLPPLVAMHWGGPVRSVQGGGWNLIGTHSAGTTPVGSNVETSDRSGEEDAKLPFHAPGIDPVNVAGVHTLEGADNPLEDGKLAVADTAVDFLGAAVVVNTASCSITYVQITSLSGGYGLHVETCLAVGTILGDGIAFFDGTGPVDLREAAAPIFQPAPEELRTVLDAVDAAVEQVPVADVLETLTGGLPEVPGVDDDAPGDGGTDPGADPLAPVTSLLGGLLPSQR